MSDRSQALILYDGVCGLCNGATQFALPRDRRDRFVFAPLQSELGKEVLARHNKPVDVLDTFYLVLDYGKPNERLIDRAHAAIGVLRELGMPWSLARALKLVPKPLLDVGYNFVAKNRYGWFGRTDRCVLPRPEWRHKFIG